MRLSEHQAAPRTALVEIGAEGEEMTDQERLIEEIRERLSALKGVGLS
jgi:hypothetical protein